MKRSTRGTGVITPFKFVTGSNLADAGRVRCFPAGWLPAGISWAGFTCWPGRPWGRSAAYLWRCRWGRAGLLLRQADSSEHGNHPIAGPGEGAASALAGIGAPAAERVGWGGAAVVVR